MANTNSRSSKNLQEPADHDVPESDINAKAFWIIYIVLVTLGVLTRFWGLAEKPFHHDESLHAYYSHVVATGGVREYDALLHGPFLYYFVGAYQAAAGALGNLFGVTGLAESDFVARTPAAFFGVLVVSIPILLRKYIGRIGVLTLSFFLLISPTTLYFGRFLREDVFTSIWVLGAVFGGLLAFVLPDDREFSGILQLPGTKVAFPLRWIFPGTPKTNAAVFSTIMMAFHFTNKENSFLHAGIWLLAIAAIAWSSKRMGESTSPWQSGTPMKNELARRIISCTSWFVAIFVTFFSSFFRHSGGWYAGVLDGLYRKSLVYWWGQDQVRRIDGPFDYHIPILANYEFILIPFLMLAWWHCIRLSHSYGVENPKRGLFFTATATRTNATLTTGIILLLAILLLPRIAMVSDACSIVDVSCASFTLGKGDCKGANKPIACLLHISHTRHLLQIVLYVIAGGAAFLANVHTKRHFDAFLWFWLTGALGTYSYVGEKVPWLTIYVLLPLLLLSGLEVARMLSRKELPLYSLESEEFPKTPRHQPLFSARARTIAVIWIVVAAPFTLWKALRVAIIQPASPSERLVFTQTTPDIKTIQDRFRDARRLTDSDNIRIGVEGEATWPVAWFMMSYRDYDFLSQTDGVKEILKKPRFDAMIINETNLIDIKQNFTDFRIYRVPLRGWWVPKPNPSLVEMLTYFFTGKPYPQTDAPDRDAQVGMGATSVIYLEYSGLNSPFNKLPPPSFGERLL